MKKKLLTAIILVCAAAVVMFLAPPPRIVVVLSPHFDDAALSLGGLLAQNNSPEYVLTFFTGKPASTTTAWDESAGFTNSESAATARIVENNNALTLLKATDVHFSYLDHQYRTNDDAVQNNIEKDITTFIQNHRSEHVDLYAPAEFGAKITHPDHELLHQAILHIRETHDFSNVDYYFYEDFPYVSLFTEATQNTQSLQSFMEQSDNVTLQEKIIPLTEAELAKKLTAIKDYTSQMLAFKALGYDIKKRTETFSKNRCPRTTEYAGCEAVYELITPRP